MPASDPKTPTRASRPIRRVVQCLFLCAALSACATGDPVRDGALHDPYEGFNRQMFAFNSGLDRYAIEPAAEVYETVTPEFARDRVSDFFGNLREPVVFANDVMQGETQRAGTTLTRFSLNSTIGLLGLWDVAGHLGFEGHREDFGQTLAVWGTASGPFLILPLLGPTTPRDLLGTAVDRFIDPLAYVEVDDDWETALAVRGGLNLLNGLNIRVRVDDQIASLNAQPEPYIALKRIYSSSRQAEILNGRIDESTAYDDLPDFDLPEEESPEMAGDGTAEGDEF